MYFGQRGQMRHRLRAYLPVRAAWPTGRPAEGSARSAALNVGRTPGRSCAGSRSLAQLPRCDAAWALRCRRLGLSLGWCGGALNEPAGRARRSPVSTRRSAACGEPGCAGNYRARGEHWLDDGRDRQGAGRGGRPARSLPRREPDWRKTCCRMLGGVSAWQPASLPSPPAIGGRSLSRKEGRR
jgi:hypothetical protein